MPEKSEALNILVKGAAIVAVGNIVSKIMTYFYRVIVARFIGPDAYGQLSLGLSVLSIAGTLSLIGLNQAINKYVAEYDAKSDPASVKGVVLASIQITLPLSILAGAVLYLGSGFIARTVFESEALIPMIKLFGLLVPFANLSSIGTATITAFKEMKYRVLVNQIFQPLVQLVATVLLVIQGQGVMGAAMGWFIGVVAGTGLRFYFLERRIGPIITRKVEPSYNYRRLLKFSGPLVFTAIIGSILGYMDTIFLGYFLDDSQVGFYNAAFPTAVLILLPYKALSTIALPSISEVQETGETPVPVIVKNLARWVLMVSFPAFLLMAVFSRQTLHVLFGAEYMVAATALVLLAGGNLFNATTGHLSEVIKSIERTDILFKNSVGSLILNLPLNLLLIPLYGIEGAALATLLSTVIMNTVLILEAYYFEGFTPIHRESWKPVFSGLAALIAVYLLLHLAFETVPIWALVPGAVVFGSVYLAVLVAVRGPNERDRDIIVSFAEDFGKKELGEKIADFVIR